MPLHLVDAKPGAKLWMACVHEAAGLVAASVDVDGLSVLGSWVTLPVGATVAVVVVGCAVGASVGAAVALAEVLVAAAVGVSVGASVGALVAGNWVVGHAHISFAAEPVNPLRVANLTSVCPPGTFLRTHKLLCASTTHTVHFSRSVHSFQHASPVHVVALVSFLIARPK